MTLFQRIVHLALILVALPSPAAATMQGPEILLYEGKSYDLYNAAPLSSFYKRNKDRPNFAPMDTAHWRGHIGTWEIDGGMLYFTHIDAWIETETGRVRANLAMLFGERCVDGRVAATWFTGKLALPEGEVIERRFMRSSLYERETILHIESVKVTGKERVDNTKTADLRALNAEMFKAIENGDIPEVETLLEKASLVGRTKMVKILLDTSPEVGDGDLAKALKLAVYDGHGEIMKMLLDRGANPKRTYGGRTLFESAQEEGYSRIAEMLEKASAGE